MRRRCFIKRQREKSMEKRKREGRRLILMEREMCEGRETAEAELRTEGKR